MFNCITLHDVQSVTVNGDNCIFVKHLSVLASCVCLNHRSRKLPACSLFINASNSTVTAAAVREMYSINNNEQVA